MRQALSACTRAARGSTPQASSTRDQATRNARNFDNVASSSALGREPKRDHRAGFAERRPCLFKQTQ